MDNDGINTDELVLKSPALEGYLLKKGIKGIGKGWKKRWFSLSVKDKKLYYYKTTESLKSGAGEQGFIDMGGRFDVEMKGHSCNFDIKTEDRIWQLQADSQEETRFWVDGLCAFALANSATATTSATITSTDATSSIVVAHHTNSTEAKSVTNNENGNSTTTTAKIKAVSTLSQPINFPSTPSPVRPAPPIPHFANANNETSNSFAEADNEANISNFDFNAASFELSSEDYNPEDLDTVEYALQDAEEELAQKQDQIDGLSRDLQNSINVIKAKAEHVELLQEKLVNQEKEYERMILALKEECAVANNQLQVKERELSEKNNQLQKLQETSLKELEGDFISTLKTKDQTISQNEEVINSLKHDVAQATSELTVLSENNNNLTNVCGVIDTIMNALEEETIKKRKQLQYATNASSATNSTQMVTAISESMEDYIAFVGAIGGLYSELKTSNFGNSEKEDEDHQQSTEGSTQSSQNIMRHSNPITSDYILQQILNLKANQSKRQNKSINAATSKTNRFSSLFRGKPT